MNFENAIIAAVIFLILFWFAKNIPSVTGKGS